MKITLGTDRTELIALVKSKKLFWFMENSIIRVKALSNFSYSYDLNNETLNLEFLPLIGQDKHQQKTSIQIASSMDTRTFIFETERELAAHIMESVTNRLNEDELAIWQIRYFDGWADRWPDLVL